MSKLSAFLNPVLPEEKEVLISNRFLDENGNPIPFRIRAITQDESDAMTKLCKKSVRVGNQMQETLDSVEFSKRMVVAGTVYPAFDDQEICKAYGVLDPLLVPGKMLLAGEFARLSAAIGKLSGFDEELEGIAKN